MRKLLLSTTVAALLAASGVANATIQNLGTVSSAIPESFNAIVDKGEFVDFFKFALPTASGTGFSVMDFKIPGFNVRFDSFSLFSNADGKIGTSDDLKLGYTDTTSGKGLSFNVGPTDAGSYFLMITGKGLAKSGGLYNGSISVTAVPEPETFALMFAGLGLIGTITRRRSKAKTD